MAKSKGFYTENTAKTTKNASQAPIAERVLYKKNRQTAQKQAHHIYTPGPSATPVNRYASGGVPLPGYVPGRLQTMGTHRHQIKPRRPPAAKAPAERISIPSIPPHLVNILLLRRCLFVRQPLSVLLQVSFHAVSFPQ